MMDNQIQVQPSKTINNSNKSKTTKSDEKLFVSYLKQQDNTKQESTKSKNSKSEQKDIEEQEDETIEKSGNIIELSNLVAQLIKGLQKNPDALKQLGSQDVKQVISIMNQYKETGQLTQEEKGQLEKIMEQIQNSEPISSSVNQISEVKVNNVKENSESLVFQEKIAAKPENEQHKTASVSKDQLGKIDIELQQLIKLLKSGDNSALQNAEKPENVEEQYTDLINYIKQINLVGKQERKSPVSQLNTISQVEDNLTIDSQSVQKVNVQPNEETGLIAERPLMNTITSDIKETNIKVEMPQTDIAAQKNVRSENISVAAKEISTVLNKDIVDQLQSMVTEKIQNPGKPETIKSTVQLTPESLGKVTIELEMIDNKLIGKLVVSSEDAKRLVEQQLKNFTGNTATQSVKFDKIEVLVTPAQEAFDAAFNFSDQQQSNQKFQQVIKNKKLYLANSDLDPEIESPIETEMNKGRVNVIA
ncbi:flagellar hook-length control protein FliK [Marinilactibacillus psychrotolerans]|uniref:Flagellar hook-length control protein FliK n=2 Tax=Marinilactibacillus psychrotolerans TaxID=191770 RepID=A0A5R9C7W3_9LACT|nr:flagellar hook-length control protein FliK [Marinilactibacillus psychrotolerans]